MDWTKEYRQSLGRSPSDSAAHQVTRFGTDANQPIQIHHVTLENRYFDFLVLLESFVLLPEADAELVVLSPNVLSASCNELLLRLAGS